MQGRDPIEKQNLETGDYLYVHELFYTLQGEGPFTGCPAVFVRLAGCNLQCHWCDTEFDQHNRMYLNFLVEAIEGLTPKALVELGRRPIVVLTGGEPLRQNVVPLVKRLLNLCYHVQFETAGTLWLDGLMAEDCITTPYPHPGSYSIVCSPKTPQVNHDLMYKVMAWKYVLRVGEVSPHDGLPNVATQVGIAGKPQMLARPPISLRGQLVYVSPCWEGEGADAQARTAANIVLAKETAMQWGYRLSLQTHRMLGLP